MSWFVCICKDLHASFELSIQSRKPLQGRLLKDAVFRVIIAAASAAADVVSGGFVDDADNYEGRS